VQSVSLQRGDTKVFQNFNLQVQHGEQVALVGPSGAGKTSLLRMMAGGIPAESGDILHGDASFAGATPKELRSLRARVGFIHQDHALVPNLRVCSNIVAGRFGRQGLLPALRALIAPTQETRLEVLQLLDQVGIGDKIYHRVDSLSGGEQQRVAIVRALFQKPDALLADEPVASVDPERARDVIGILTKVAQEHNLTLVVSIHDIALAKEFFPRVVGLRQGKIMFDTAPLDLQEGQLQELYSIQTK
jgi:phosphonate transport system ATP-binding protein